MSLRSILANMDLAAFKNAASEPEQDQENGYKNPFEREEADVLWRIQSRLDELAAKDIAYINGLSNEGIYGLSIIRTVYTPKWFNECLYSDKVQDQIKELLIEKYESFGPGYTPQFLIDMKNGKTPINIRENIRISGIQAFEKLAPQN